MLWLVIIFLIFLGLSIGFSFAVCHRRAQKNYHSPAEFDLAFEEVNLCTRDGIHLYGWWIPVDGSKRTLILLHGFCGSCDPDLKYVPAFHARGYNVLMFDFRAHGRSGGIYSSIGALEKQDCQAAVNYALSRGSTAIGLMGFSMGGRVALLSASKLPPQVKAIISDGGPARLTTAISGEMTSRKIPRWLAAILAFMVELGMSLCTGIDLFQQEPWWQAASLSPLPVLFIHGDLDPCTRVDELEHMVQTAGINAESWRIPEAGHRNADVYRPEEYLQKVTAFFERWVTEE